MTSFCPTCLRHVNGAVSCPGCGALASGLPQVPDLPAPRLPSAGPRHRAPVAPQSAARERRRVRLTLATAAVGLLAAGVVGASGAPQSTRTGDAAAGGAVQVLRPDGPHSGLPSVSATGPAAAVLGGPSAGPASPIGTAGVTGGAAAAGTAPPAGTGLPPASSSAPHRGAPPEPVAPTAGRGTTSTAAPSAPTTTGTGGLAPSAPPTSAPPATPTAAPSRPADGSGTPTAGADCALRLLVLCLG